MSTRQGGAVPGSLGEAVDATEPHEALELLRVRTRQQAVVAELGQRALAGAPLDVLADDAVTVLAGMLDTEYAEVLELLPERGELLLRAGVGWRPGMVGEALIPADAASQAGYVLRAVQPVIVEDLETEDRFPSREFLAEHGIRSGLSVLITTWEGPFGVLAAHTTRRRTFSEDDVHFLQSVANILGAAVERARVEERLRVANNRLELALRAAETAGRRFRRLAGTLQQSLLPPHLPRIAGLELASVFRPTAKGVDVGGDFYDVFPLRGRDWGVVVGDVCGKGPEAATLTALARYTLRAAAMQQRGPSRAVAVLNDAVLRDAGPDNARFLTVAFATLRPTDDGFRCVVCCGGHPPPLVLRAEGGVEAVGAPGMLVGVFPDAALAEEETLLSGGDLLLLCTDGVWEARGPQGVFGEDRLAEALAACQGLGAREALARIEQSVLVHSRAGVRDDLAMLAVKVQGPPRHDLKDRRRGESPIRRRDRDGSA